MNFLKKLFSKSEKKKEKVEIVDEYAHLPKCAYCKQPIFDDQVKKSFGGKKYHAKPCFRIVKKEAKKMAANGDINTLKYMTA